MLPIKTKEDFLTLLRTALTGMNSNLNTADHSVAWDISLYPASVLSEKLWQLADFVNRSSSLTGIQQIANDAVYKEQLRQLFQYSTVDEVDTLISSILDGIVGNWNVVRVPAVSAQGPVRFYVASASPVTVEAGGTVSTRGTSPQIYTVLAGCTDLVPSFDSSRALYYVELTVSADVAGAVGNVATNKITIMVDSFPSIIMCSNPIALTGGKDAETDDDLIARATSMWRSWSLDTRTGLESLLEQQPGVSDAYVSSRDDPLTTREGVVSPVDIFVIVDALTSSVVDTILAADAIAVARASMVSTDSISYPPATGDTFAYVFNHQPATSLVSVVSGVEITGCTFYADTDSQSGSTRSRSYVVIPTAQVATGDTLTITYNHNARIPALQNVVDSPEYNLLSTDVLVRDGKSLSANLTITAAFFTGGSYPTVAEIKAVAEQDLAVFFTGGLTSSNRRYTAKKLGERIDQSDILQVLLDVSGIDRVDTSALVINSTAVTSYYQPKNSEYVRLDTVAWV